MALHSGQFWPVSVALAARAMGATVAGMLSCGNFSTATAVRTARAVDQEAAISPDTMQHFSPLPLTATRSTIRESCPQYLPQPLPPTTLSKSGGGERVKEQRDDQKTRMKEARKASLTAGDENYDNFLGTKDGPGRYARGRHYPSTCSPSRHGSSGASTSSDDNRPVRI